MSDTVTCITCHKSLDGWDPEDDPLAEHQSHAPSCPLMAALRQESASAQECDDTSNHAMPAAKMDAKHAEADGGDMTVEEYLRALCDSEAHKFVIACEARINDFMSEAAKVRASIDAM